MVFAVKTWIVGQITSVMIVSGLLVGPALAQQESAAGTDRVGVMLADQFVLLGRQALVAMGDPREDQLQRARILLDLALGLNPKDAEAVRLRMELAQRMGDDQLESHYLRKYCRLSPKDDAAQLRLILNALASRQTLQRRALAARKIVDGKKANRISKALQSRLALIVAESALETGRFQEASVRVKQAVALDPSNRQATQFAYQLALRKGPESAAVGSALLAVIRSDPLNHQPREGLAMYLLSAGEYETAAEQFEVGWGLGVRHLDPNYFFRWAMSLAASGQDEQALILVANYEAELVRKQNQAQEGQAVGLAPDLELLRLVIAKHLDKKDIASRSIARLTNYYEPRVQAGDAQGTFDWVWYSLFFELGDIGEPVVKQVIEQFGQAHPATVRVLGWHLIRSKQFDQAREVFERTATSDPFTAYGMARTFQDGDEGERKYWLAKALDLAPSTTAGLLAIYELDDAKPSNPIGRAIKKVIGAWPSQLASPTPAPNDWSRIRLSIDQPSYEYLEPIKAKFELYNPTDIDLSIGADGTIPSRLFIYTSTRKGGVLMPEHAPIVVDLGRRIRLESRKSIELDLRLDRADLGAVLQSKPFDTLSIGITAILDPRNTSSGRPQPGPLGAKIDGTLIRRPGAGLHQNNLRAWLDDLSDPDVSVQVRSVARLLKSLPAVLNGGPEIAQLATEIGRSLNEYYLNSEPMIKAWMLCFMDPIRQVQTMLKQVEASATRSDEPIVRIAYLATHIDDATLPALTASLRHDHDDIRNFATALRDGILVEKESSTP